MITLPAEHVRSEDGGVKEWVWWFRRGEGTRWIEGYTGLERWWVCWVARRGVCGNVRGEVKAYCW